MDAAGKPVQRTFCLNMSELDHAGTHEEIGALIPTAETDTDTLIEYTGVSTPTDFFPLLHDFRLKPGGGQRERIGRAAGLLFHPPDGTGNLVFRGDSDFTHGNVPAVVGTPLLQEEKETVELKVKAFVEDIGIGEFLVREIQIDDDRILRDHHRFRNCFFIGKLVLHLQDAFGEKYKASDFIGFMDRQIQHRKAQTFREL